MKDFMKNYWLFRSVSPFFDFFCDILYRSSLLQRATN